MELLRMSPQMSSAMLPLATFPFPLISSPVGDWGGNGLQLFKISVAGGVSGFGATFFRFELPRRIFKLDFREGAGDAAVIVMSIFVSCCSSSPDCSTQVGSKPEPVGECFDPVSLCELNDGLLRSAFVAYDDRSRKILSSSAFNEPKTDGGVKWIFGGS